MINEATATYDNPEIEIGLMTYDEFLDFRNKDKKMHSSDIWDYDLKKLNQVNYGTVVHRFNRTAYLFRTYPDGVTTISKDEGKYKPIGYFDNTTIYYTRELENLVNYLTTKDGRVRYTYDDKVVIDVANKKEIKYFDYTPPNRQLEGFTPYQRLKLGNAPFTLYKNNENDLKMVNEDGMVVGTAQDEWGATLIIVAREYRGAGIGKILGKAFYQLNPNKPSGGFTRGGMNNAIQIWADRVREMLSHGWYSDMVRNGKITKERVNEIIKSLPEKVKKEIRDLSKSSKKIDPLIYVDEGSSFIMYDKKFFEEPSEEYIYAFGFFRENIDGDTTVYRLEYDKAFRKIANTIILQLARDAGEKIFKNRPTDMLELDGIDHQDDGKFVYLDEDVIPLKDFASYERNYRRKNDQYDEIYYQLQELANSKWD